jgi:chromosome segregation ATPase
MDQEKLDHMRSMLNRLEDIKNTQSSIIDKINHVITDLFQHPDKNLEKVMEDAHQKASDNIDAIREAMEEYEMAINKLENQG